MEARLLDDRADARERGGAPPGRSWPSRRMRPLVGWASPSSRRMSVVLPAPFGPRKPNAQPRGTCRSMDCEGGAVAEALAQAVGLDGELGHGPKLRSAPAAAASASRTDPRAPVSSLRMSGMSRMRVEVRPMASYTVNDRGRRPRASADRRAPVRPRQRVGRGPARRRRRERVPRVALVGGVRARGTSGSPRARTTRRRRATRSSTATSGACTASGLIACHYRAAEWRHKEIELAAHELLQRLDAVSG